MPSLSTLILHGALAAASVIQRPQKRQPKDTVRFGTVTNTGGSCGLWTEERNDNNDVLTIGFDDLSIYPGTESAADVHCALDVEIIYPPGCTTASLARQIAGTTSYSDTEAAQGYIINSYILSTGQWDNFATGFRLHWRDGPWESDWNMDASVSVNEDASLVVVVEVELDLRLEKFVLPSTGGMTFDRITFDIRNQTTDVDWENCSLEVESADDEAEDA